LKPNQNANFSIDFIWKSLLSLSLLIYGLSVASNILIPIVFSLFLALMLSPIVGWLERKKVNSIISIIITLILVTAVVTTAFYYISVQAKNLIVDLPNLVKKFNLFIDNNLAKLNDLYGFSSADQLKLVKENADKLISSGGLFFSEAVSATSNIITFLTLIPIYIFFFLLYRQNFKQFLAQLDERNSNSNYREMASEIKSMSHSYISGLLIVISIVTVLNVTGLLILGIKYAVFMGILSAILTVIPYIGVFIGASLPIIVALITKDSLFYPLGVAALYAFVQFVEGNFITPNIIGSKVDVNPLAAIVALIIGGQIWGIIGMILAIPMCGIMKIFFSHYKPLQPYALLLQSSSKAHTGLTEKKPLKIRKLFKKKRKK